MKLNREDRRSKSEQTHASKQTTQLTKLDRNLKMGQNNSTNALAGKRISKQFESNVEIANKIGENMLIAKYNDENLQKLIKLVKRPTKAKIKALESP